MNKIRRMAASLDIAFTMYSRVPMPMVEWSQENMRDAMCFFPLVGALIGLLFYGWGLLCQAMGFSGVFFAAIAVVLPVLVTGGIHLDGFCDTMDALGSHREVEKKLEILKDSHIGAFALIGCGALLIAQLGIFHQFSRHFYGLEVLSLGFVFSRALSGLAVVRFRCAKTSGLAATFSNAAHKRRVTLVLAGYLVVCAAGMLWLSPILGGAVLLAGAGVFLYYRVMAYRQFGGITGDLAGYFLQLCEAAMALVTAIVGGILCAL